MKKLVILFCAFCIFLPFDVHAKKARWSFGLDLADSTLAFFEPDGIHVPMSIVAGYEITENFQAYSSQIMRFPMRGGYSYVPSVGLRAHSSTIHGLTFFLGANVAYKITNVPWLKSGFIMRSHLGSRYIFNFKMYVEGGLGGSFAISANKMSPSYFLILGYML